MNIYKVIKRVNYLMLINLHSKYEEALDIHFQT